MWMGQKAKGPENISSPDSSCPAHPELLHSWPSLSHMWVSKKTQCLPTLTLLLSKTAEISRTTDSRTHNTCLYRAESLPLQKSLNPCRNPKPCNSKLLSAIKLPLWNNFSNKWANSFKKIHEKYQTHSKSCQPYLLPQKESKTEVQLTSKTNTAIRHFFWTVCLSLDLFLIHTPCHYYRSLYAHDTRVPL